MLPRTGSFPTRPNPTRSDAPKSSARAKCLRAASIVAALALGASIFLAACERRESGREPPGDPPAATSEEIALADPPVIVALGDSITAGYGVEEAVSWPALLQRRLAAEGYPHRVVNAGVSGDTSAGGLARMDWLLRRPVAILIVELGGNDGLRGLDPAATEKNLARILERGREAGARMILAGMRMPTNLGPRYRAQFDGLFPDLADRYDVPLIPFILEGVSGHRGLTLPDAIHPNAKGHRIVEKMVWEALEPLLD